MTDEAAPEATQDTQPDQAAPEGTPAPESTQDSQAQTQDTTDWAKRYADLQPEYTRASQEAAQYRQIIQLAQQGDKDAIEWLGLSLADEEDLEDEDETQQPPQDPRMDHMWQAFQEQQLHQELDTLESHVDTEIDKLAESAGYKLSDDERDLIFAALTPSEDDPRSPDVQRAFKKITGLRDAHIKDYRAGKLKPPQAPSGSSPSHQPDLDDPEQRRQYMLERLGQG